MRLKTGFKWIRYNRAINHVLHLVSTAILFRPFGFIAYKDFKIIWLSNISIFSVPDEG
jgi:hypothetical protein